MVFAQPIKIIALMFGVCFSVFANSNIDCDVVSKLITNKNCSGYSGDRFYQNVVCYSFDPNWRPGSNEHSQMSEILFNTTVAGEGILNICGHDFYVNNKIDQMMRLVLERFRTDVKDDNEWFQTFSAYIKIQDGSNAEIVFGWFADWLKMNARFYREYCSGREACVELVALVAEYEQLSLDELFSE